MAIRRLTPKDMEAAISEGVPALDVRSRPEYSSENIEGTIFASPRGVDSKAAGLDRKKPVFVFCAQGPRSYRAADRLLELGFEDVRVLEGGLVAWTEAGLPTKRTKGALTFERQVRLIAGTLSAFGALLAWAVHPAFLSIPVGVGLGMAVAALTDSCAMSMVLMRLPWNNPS